MNVLITVFTPTYNRGYTLSNLYHSLCRQSCKNFEWLIIDDGSTDCTKKLINEFINNDNGFEIRYHYKKNGGKPRALNDGIKLAKGRYFFIVDSDDYLLDDALKKMEKWINEIDQVEDIVGVGAARGNSKLEYIKGISPKIKENGFLDANNLERNKYDLDADMCEAYKIDILKKYPFIVWDNEKFSPEEIVFNDIALDGYKVRWHKDIIYVCEYLDDGLTKGNYSLLRKNPMGYAMLYNSKLKYNKKFKEKIYNSSQMIALSIIGKNFSYICKSNDKFSTFLALPIGFLISIRRKKQFRNEKNKYGG